MPVTGPVLDEVVKQAVVWYQTTIVKMMDAVEQDGYPYGSVKLSPAEQLSGYLSMTPEDWQVLFARLERRFRGLPDSRGLVEKEAARYVQRMETLKNKLGAVVPPIL